MRVTGFYACLSTPCQHGGECYNVEHDFICDCKGTYEGLMCSGRYYTIIPVIVCCTFLSNLHARVYIHTVEFAHAHAHIHVYMLHACQFCHEHNLEINMA